MTPSDRTPKNVELSPSTKPSLPARAGAIGKAFLVYLGSGSIVAAIIAYLVFAGMGC